VCGRAPARLLHLSSSLALRVPADVSCWQSSLVKRNACGARRFMVVSARGNVVVGLGGRVVLRPSGTPPWLSMLELDVVLKARQRNLSRLYPFPAEQLQP